MFDTVCLCLAETTGIIQKSQSYKRSQNKPIYNAICMRALLLTFQVLMLTFD